MTDIVATLSALAQQTRLEVIMRLSRGPASGQTSGDLATLTQTPANSMSTHLKILLRAGLVVAERSGRQVFYRIDAGGADDLMQALTCRLHLGTPGRARDNGSGQWFTALRIGEPVPIATGPGYGLGTRPGSRIGNR